MNELIFILHILFVVALVLGALRIGKEALMMLFCFQGLISNLFVFKQMELFGLTITCTDPYVIGAYLSLGLLQSYYGKKEANKALLLSFSMLATLLIVIFLHIQYFPSPSDSYHTLYNGLLKEAPRVCITSMVVAITAQKLSIYLHSLFSSYRIHKLLILFLPMAIAQLYDTVAFSYIALSGVVHSLWHVIIISYLVKLLTTSCMAPFTTLSKKFYKSPTSL